MALKFTRRALLGVIPLGLSAQGSSHVPPAKTKKPLPSVGEFTRLIDGVTENYIVRLTSPAFTSLLTGPGNQFVSIRERTLLFSSNRNGHFAPFQVDLRNGALKQIAEPGNLDPRSLCLDHAQKAAYFLDGGKLCQTALGKANTQTLGEGVTWFRTSSSGSIFAIQGGKLTLREAAEWKTLASPAIACWPQPNGAGCLFARAVSGDESEFWYLALAGGSKPVLLASGRIRDPYWDADGQSLLFLRDVTNSKGVTLSEIHGRGLNGEPEKCVSATSQFATFSPNGDCSVFVGSSRSRAQPNVVLLLRSPSREMTLCEHRSSHPLDVLPAFSPDSRRVYFESDHGGNSSIYSVSVEYLVEPTVSAG